MKTLRVTISGRVQGVWFRAWTEQQANAIGLDGWVRNRRDGSVEALFAGDDEKVDQMIARCHEGPPASDVAEVQVLPDDSDPPDGFKIISSE